MALIRVDVRRGQPVVGTERHNDLVLPSGIDQNTRCPGREIGHGDQAAIDALRLVKFPRANAERVVTDRANEGHCCARAGRGYCLIGAFATRTRHELAEHRLTRSRELGTSKSEVLHEAADNNHFPGGHEGQCNASRNS